MKNKDDHKLAVLAAAIYSKEYRASKITKNEFWEKQSAYNQAACRIILRRIEKAEEVRG